MLAPLLLPLMASSPVRVSAASHDDDRPYDPAV